MKAHPRKLPQLLALTLAACCLLSACVPAILGGAVVGSMMALDRRTSGAQIDDEAIELRSAGRMRELFGERAHLNVTSYNRQVLLTGEVPTAQDKAAAEQAVSRVENVRSVVNEVVVTFNSTLGNRSNDTLLTGKVKASLVDARTIYANAFKVVTERGVTYLLGRVTQREADRATAITRGVSGVVKVVRVLEVISEEELQRISSNPAATAPARPAASAPRP